MDANLLQRGLKYIIEEHLLTLEELVNDYWNAEGVGSEMYEVEIALARTKVKQYDFSSSYNLGLICKHVIAELYARCIIS